MSGGVALLALWVALGALASLSLMGLLWPYALLRLVMALLTRSVLWLRSAGAASLPSSGPFVLLCSPLSYLGWLLLLAASPRRLRFLVLAGWGRKGWPGWLLRQAGAIVVRGDAIEAALAQARDAPGAWRGRLPARPGVPHRWRRMAALARAGRAGRPSRPPGVPAPAAGKPARHAWRDLRPQVAAALAQRRGGLLRQDPPRRHAARRGPPGAARAVGGRGHRPRAAPPAGPSPVRPHGRPQRLPHLLDRQQRPRPGHDLRQGLRRGHVPGRAAQAAARRRQRGGRVAAAGAGRGPGQRRPRLFGQDLGQPQLHRQPRRHPLRPAPVRLPARPDRPPVHCQDAPRSGPRGGAAPP